jgi:hypothetical protein
MNHNLKQIKVVKIQDIIKQNDTKDNIKDNIINNDIKVQQEPIVKRTYTRRKDKYTEMLNSTERIKELLQNKLKSKKNLETNKYSESKKNLESNKEKMYQFKDQFKKTQNNKDTKITHRFYKTQKKSKTKRKEINKNTINSIFKAITLTKKSKINRENIIRIFKKILKTNNIELTNTFIKKINRRQTVLLLSILDIVNINSKAPLPLLKNLLYNYLTTDIKIII